MTTARTKTSGKPVPPGKRKPAPNPKNIVWLASYPKSGNTWVRIFLANYIFNPAEPMPINEIHRLGMGDAIAAAYAKVCKGQFDAKNRALTLSLRNRVLRGIANNGADINFVKTHNIRKRAPGADLIPDALTKSGVYIVRDPRDMAISYARQYGLTHDKAVEAIGRSDNSISGGGGTVTQYLGGWSEHIASWTRRKGTKTAFPILVLRYEDMLESPQETFGKLLDFTGIALGDDARRDRAIRFSSIGELQKQEKTTPFIERSRKSEAFFKRGTSGHWRDILTEEQAAEIARAHGPTMRRFGYLP